MESDTELKGEILQIGALHNENEEVQQTIKKILMDDIDNDVMLRETQKIDYVFN